MPESPFYRLMRNHDLKMSYEKWDRFPRIIGYKNEYWDGEAHYTPRPNSADIFLDLRNLPKRLDGDPAFKSIESIWIKPLQPDDWPELALLFHSAFAEEPPLRDWGRGAARAARTILNYTRNGGDGPVVNAASFVAWTNGRYAKESQELSRCGAAIVTLSPANRMRGQPADADFPDPEKPEHRVIPHLDWIFVNRFMWRHGVATMLLEDIALTLRRMNYKWLASTCLLQNGPSLLWHWRNGFQLPLTNGFSIRAERGSTDERK